MHATGPGPCRPAPWTGGSAPTLLPLPFLLPVLSFLILAGLGAAFLVRAFRRRLAALEAEAEALRQCEARYRTVAGMGSDFAFSCVPAAGGGMVTVTMDGHKRLKALRIAPEAVDPADVDMLQDLVLAAVNDARAQIEEKLKSSLGGLAGGRYSRSGTLVGACSSATMRYPARSSVPRSSVS